MKIADLKQPYKRMAEYLAEENTSQHYNDKTILNRAFKWSFDWNDISRLFWKEVDKGHNPPITEEIKKHFPPDFDFSGEDVKPLSDFENLPLEIQKRMLFEQQLQGNPKNPEIFKEDIIADKQNGGFSWVATRDGDKFWTVVVIHKQFNLFFEKYPERYPSTQCDEACYYHCTEGGNINPKCINERYTKLAKEGKFDQLPDTCEFSEPVELEVWDDLNSENKRLKKVIGKFKGLYCVLVVGNTTIDSYQNAQLPTPKIDFLQFKSGDVVEVETISVGYMYGYIREVESDKLLLSLGYMSDVLRTIRKEKIKSITKIK